MYYERKFKKKGYNLIIGVDEVGRGPLAGPVVAAAVALRTIRFRNRIDDSKKLTPPARERAFFELLDKSVFGIGIVNEKIIDKLNIENATRIAMRQAVDALLDKLKPLKKKRIHILIDGNIRPDFKLSFTPHLCRGAGFTNIIRGDAKSKSIASASILAKVTRDRIMSLYDKIYPQYGFLRHKGYATRQHRFALRKFGASQIHRMTFSCV